VAEEVTTEGIGVTVSLNHRSKACSAISPADHIGNAWSDSPVAARICARTAFVWIPLARLFKTRSFNGGRTFLYTVGRIPSFPVTPLSYSSNVSLHHPTPKPSMLVRGLGEPVSLAEEMVRPSRAAALDRDDDADWSEESVLGSKGWWLMGRKCSSTAHCQRGRIRETEGQAHFA